MCQKHIAKSPEFFTSITNLFGTEPLPPDSRPLPVPLGVAVRHRCDSGAGAGGGIGHVGGGGVSGVAGGHHVVLVEVGAVTPTNGPVITLKFFKKKGDFSK